MDEPTTQTEPTPQATLPPVKAVNILCSSALDVAYRCDLSAYPGLDYRILSLMPSNDIVAKWHIT